MALDQLENNVNIENEIAAQIELEFVKLVSVGIHVNTNIHEVWSLHGPIQQPLGPVSAELELRFYVDQIERRPNPILLGELEKKIGRFISETNGSFNGRHLHEDFNGTKILDYKLKLHNYETFIETLNRLSRKRIDKEFTKALEAKLSED